MSYLYEFFGFTALSNTPIPGLHPTTNTAATLRVVLGSRPPASEQAAIGPEKLIFESSYLTEAGAPVLRIFSEDGSRSHLVFSDDTEFWLDERGGKIWGIWPDSLTIDDAATYLLGPVLGVLLRRRGISCLHASAVVLQGKAVLFVGPSGAGKSTTAASLARRGHAVLADDIVAIAEQPGRFLATPAYPYVSLWPESVKMLYGSETKLPQLSASFPKRRLSLYAASSSFQGSALALGVIFALSDNPATPSTPVIEPLSQTEGLMTLVANSYATNILNDQMRAAEFELFSRIIKSVPVHRLCTPKNPNLLDHLCDLIEHSCAFSEA